MTTPVLTPVVAATQTLAVPPNGLLYPSATTFPGASTFTVPTAAVAVAASPSSALTLTPA